jgi:hypothetical protein
MSSKQKLEPCEQASWFSPCSVAACLASINSHQGRQPSNHPNHHNHQRVWRRLMIWLMALLSILLCGLALGGGGGGRGIKNWYIAWQDGTGSSLTIHLPPPPPTQWGTRSLFSEFSLILYWTSLPAPQLLQARIPSVHRYFRPPLLPSTVTSAHFLPLPHSHHPSPVTVVSVALVGVMSILYFRL